jgi:tripartite-type tricarboxylate transporter receptor subunit TctC
MYRSFRQSGCDGHHKNAENRTHEGTVCASGFQFSRLNGVALGQSGIIENRPGGAGSIIGSKMVASSEPDGRTLLWSYPGPLTTAPLIYENLDYDPTKSVAPVATIFSSPFF